jgi:hypothetical protein
MNVANAANRVATGSVMIHVGKLVPKLAASPPPHRMPEQSEHHEKRAPMDSPARVAQSAVDQGGAILGFVIDAIDPDQH